MGGEVSHCCAQTLDVNTELSSSTPTDIEQSARDFVTNKLSLAAESTPSTSPNSSTAKRAHRGHKKRRHKSPHRDHSRQHKHKSKHNQRKHRSRKKKKKLRTPSSEVTNHSSSPESDYSEDSDIDSDSNDLLLEMQRKEAAIALLRKQNEYLRLQNEQFLLQYGSHFSSSNNATPTQRGTVATTTMTTATPDKRTNSVVSSNSNIDVISQLSYSMDRGSMALSVGCVSAAAAEPMSPLTPLTNTQTSIILSYTMDQAAKRQQHRQLQMQKLQQMNSVSARPLHHPQLSGFPDVSALGSAANISKTRSHSVPANEMTK